MIQQLQKIRIFQPPGFTPNLCVIVGTRGEARGQLCGSLSTSLSAPGIEIWSRGLLGKRLYHWAITQAVSHSTSLCNWLQFSTSLVLTASLLGLLLLLPAMPPPLVTAGLVSCHLSPRPVSFSRDCYQMNYTPISKSCEVTIPNRLLTIFGDNIFKEV